MLIGYPIFYAQGVLTHWYPLDPLNPLGMLEVLVIVKYRNKFKISLFIYNG